MGVSVFGKVGLIVMTVFAVLLWGCGGGGGSSDASLNSKMEMSSGAVAINGNNLEAEIRVLVRDHENSPLSGSSVTFETDFGVFLASGSETAATTSTAVTDSTGYARVTLSSPAAGTATVQAYGPDGMSAQKDVVLESDAMAFERLQVLHTPVAILGNLYSSHVQARFQALDGTAYADSPVSFVTDFGGFSADGSASASSSMTVQTDANGYARLYLTSPDTGEASLNIYGPDDLEKEQYSITLDTPNPEDELLDVSITPSSSQIGSISRAIRIYLRNLDGTPRANAQVSLTTDFGLLYRETEFDEDDPQGFLTITESTDDAGMLVYHLVSNVAGVANLSVYGPDSLEIREAISLSLPDATLTPAHLDLFSSSNNLTMADTLEITAQVTDVSGYLIPGQTVIFVVNHPAEGELSTSSAVTGPDGRASVVFWPLQAMNSIEITARTSIDQQIEDDMSVNVSP